MDDGFEGFLYDVSEAVRKSYALTSQVEDEMEYRWWEEAFDAWCPPTYEDEQEWTEQMQHEWEERNYASAMFGYDGYVPPPDVPPADHDSDCECEQCREQMERDAQRVARRIPRRTGGGILGGHDGP